MSTWDDFWGTSRGGDGARQDTPPAVTLRVNGAVRARRERERARTARSSRRARQVRADRQRKINKMGPGW